MPEETSSHCQIHHADLTQINKSLSSLENILFDINNILRELLKHQEHDRDEGGMGLFFKVQEGITKLGEALRKKEYDDFD